MDPNPAPNPITFNFTYPPSLSRFAISPQSYLLANPTLTDLVVSATLFDTPFPSPSPSPSSSNTTTTTTIQTPRPPRTLLIQRAPTDAYPLTWECPGGGVELGPSGDPTILHALARELLEETGLKMARVEALIDEGCEFWNKKGTVRARKFTFVVGVDLSDGKQGEGMEVVLNPEEHTDIMWASEEEVVSGEEDGEDGERGRKIVFGFADQRERILEGFRLMSGGGGSTCN